MATTDLREARRAAGLSQDELARRVGVSQSDISRLERGYRKLPGALLQRLEAALGIAPTEPQPAKVDE